MNKIANSLKNTSNFIWGAGAVAGLLLGNMVLNDYVQFDFDFDDNYFNWSLGIGYWASAFVMGIVLRGLSEIIVLLDEGNDFKRNLLYELKLTRKNTEQKKVL